MDVGKSLTQAARKESYGAEVLRFRPERYDIDNRAQKPHIAGMSDAVLPSADYDEEAAELAALTAAVNKSRANRRGVPHSEMREWLLEIAAGNLGAKPPESRDL